METLTLLLFCAALVVCVALNWSILYALAVGLVIFLAYGRRRGYGWRELGSMCLDGVKTARNILVTFLLIGVLTALWRASGTIPAIISYTTPFIPALCIPFDDLFAQLLGFGSDRYRLWRGGHYGSHLRHSGHSHGSASGADRRRGALRRVLRRPMLSCVHQRSAGGRAYPDQHL
mgnify:CR=1 FL=1